MKTSKTLEKYEKLVGKTFGKLVVIEVTKTISEFNKVNHGIKCLCECGKIVTPKVSKLTGGSIVSCGCFRDRQWAKGYYAWVKNEDKRSL